MLGLNIGCGDKLIREIGWEWVNTDIREDVGADWVCDLAGPWPWKSDWFDKVIADNVLEHFYSEDAIHVINEIGRVLKPMGQAIIIVPHKDSQGAAQDPTHKSFWVPRSALYWSSRYTKHGGRAVGITAELVKLSEPYVYGDMDTEAFIRFEVFKDAR